MSAQVRSVTSRDCSVWLELRRALWPDADQDELERECNAYFRNERIFLTHVLLFENDGILGMLELSLRSIAEGCSTSPVPYIEGWFVRSEARRKGVGRALVRAAEEWARSHGYREIASNVQIANRLSEAAHKALGFEEVDRVVAFRKSL